MNDVTNNDARYAIGIDLGTTHSALSYVDLQASDGEKADQGVLGIPQLSAPGTVEALPLLPSFLYLPHPDELAPGELALPWTNGQAAPAQSYVIGEMARSRGASTPIRLVSSAKSWLSHPSVDRRAAILPTDAPGEVERVSPLAASTRYLEHLKAAWNATHPDAPFEQQAVTVTIPASFDPAARELTAEAARSAGYGNPTLLEEPQAALYSWIEGSGGGWRKQVKAGDIVLVVDVGGGTSDFSLIAILVQLAIAYRWLNPNLGIATIAPPTAPELTVIAACVIGGISIAGGIGSVGGAVLGSLFLGLINNALPVIDVSPFWQTAISGAAIILAVIFNARGERRKGRLILRRAEE